MKNKCMSCAEYSKCMLDVDHKYAIGCVKRHCDIAQSNSHTVYTSQFDNIDSSCLGECY